MDQSDLSFVCRQHRSPRRLQEQPPAQTHGAVLGMCQSCNQTEGQTLSRSAGPEEDPDLPFQGQLHVQIEVSDPVP